MTEKKYQDRLAELKTDAERAAVIKPKIIKPIEGFLSYDDHGKACLQTINPDGLKIPPYNIFNPNRFRRYFPKGNSGVLFGGELTLNARDWNVDKKEKSFWEVHAFLMMAMAIGLISIVAAWFVPF